MVIIQLCKQKLLAHSHPAVPDPITGCLFFLRLAFVYKALEGISKKSPHGCDWIQHCYMDICLCVGNDLSHSSHIVCQLPVILPVRILEKLGRRSVMLCNILNGIIKGMEIVEIDAAASQTVNHPLCILHIHGPANAVEALDHSVLPI